MKQFQATLVITLAAASLEEAREQLGDIASSNDGTEMLANAEITEVKNHPTRSPDREANERYIHLRNTNNSYENGRIVTDVTAFIRTKDGVDYVSFAEKDARDQYCRRTGRVIARRKWFNGKRVPLLNVEGESLYEQALETYYDKEGAFVVEASS